MSKKNKPTHSKTGARILWVMFIVAIGLVSYAAYKVKDEVFSSSHFNEEVQYGFRSNKYANLKGEISRFFAGVYDSAWARKKTDRSFSVDLGNKPLIQILDEMYQIEHDPLSYQWRGSIQTRWFLADETLQSNLKKMVAEESLELIWWLDKDYIVQKAFKVHSDMVNTTDRIARSLQSHHPDQPQAYLCPYQRVILVAEKDAVQPVLHYCKSIRTIWYESREP